MYPLNTIADLVVLPASVFRVVSSILYEIEESMKRSSLLEDFKMSELPALKAKCIQLVELLVTITIENERLRLTMQLFLIAGY
jgi:callose synthase